MYDELIKRLRAGEYTLEELSIILPKAADAIEELSMKRDAACWGCKCEKTEPSVWIPVTERLPEENQNVLVYLFKNSPYIAWHEGECWCTEELWLDEDEYPTHWMLLPESPKEET